MVNALMSAIMNVIAMMNMIMNVIAMMNAIMNVIMNAIMKVSMNVVNVIQNMTMITLFIRTMFLAQAGKRDRYDQRQLTTKFLNLEPN